MQTTLRCLLVLAAVCVASLAGADERQFDPELAKKLGADERGMKTYVLCILKTGPADAEIKGDARKEIFAGHFANINKLADEGKLAVAGPFGKNDKSYRGLYIFNVSTIEEAEKLVVLDIPLLYETGAPDRCDCVLVVSAPARVQRERVIGPAWLAPRS